MNKKISDFVGHKTSNVRIIYFLVLLSFLSFVAFSNINNNLELSQNLNVLLVQFTFAMSFLTFISFLVSDEGEYSNTLFWSSLRKWGALFVPIIILLYFLLQEPSQNSNPLNGRIVLSANLIIWTYFAFNYSTELNKTNDKNYSSLSIFVCSAWLVTGILQLMVVFPQINNSLVFIYNSENINFLFSLKALMSFTFVLYALIYIANELYTENDLIPKVPSIGSIKIEDYTKYDFINSIINTLQYILNLIISIINPVIQIIGTILLFFLYVIPKLVFQFVLLVSRISLLILPSILIICLLVIAGFLIMKYSLDISLYIQSMERIVGKSIIFPKLLIVFSVLIVILALFKLVLYLPTLENKTFSMQSDFNKLPFSIVYLLFLMIVVGWILKLSFYNIEIGIFALVGTYFLGIGFISIIIMQVAKKGK